MKKVILFFVLVLLVFKTNAQECGTPGPTSPVPNFTPPNSSTNDMAPICAKVFFHIVRNAAGTNGFNAANIPQLVANLNQAFNQQNIFIVSSGSDEIRDDRYGVEFNDIEFNDLIAVNAVQASFNIYLLPVNVTGIAPVNEVYKGKAAGVPSFACVIANDFILSSTLPHELGHCFYLLHTHHPKPDSNCSPTVCGPSCSDEVCDTPIDPVLTCGTNTNSVTCNYTGANGFNPLTNNFMSYSCNNCRTAFTPGQGERMRNALTYGPVFINSNAVSVNCIDVTGPNPVCSSGGLFTVFGVPLGSIVNWSLSNNNYATISSSGNNCLVTPYLNGNGSATLVCSIVRPTGTLVIEKSLILGTGHTISFTQKDVTCENRRPYFFGAIKEVPFAGISYEWYLRDNSNVNNLFVLKDSGSNTADFPLRLINKSFTVRVTCTTPCGVKQSIDAEGLIFSGSCANLRVAANPNPSTESPILNFEEEFDKNTFASIKLYDYDGKIGVMDIYGVFL